MRLSGLDVDATKALTIKYFRINYEATGGDWSQIQPPPVVNVDTAKGAVEIIVTAKVPTIFGTIGGIDNIDIGKTSVAMFKSTDLEISLQLDLTGSMGWDSVTDLPKITTSTKISELQTAAKDFVDIMIPNTKGPNEVRIGLAPFAAGVNAGIYLKDVDGNRSSADNCTYERKQVAYQATDDVPTLADPLKIKGDLSLGATLCPTASVMAMTSDKVALAKAIDKFEADHGTAGHLGTAWAYYLLSPKWNNIWKLATKPADYNDDKTKKIAVLMTDGDYNTVGGTGSGLSNGFALDTCAAMKANGIIIYTVGFGKGISPSAKAVLGTCASGPDHALIAANGDQLHSAFKEIANQITTLRLTQ
jgi:hypothetical protein